ncbi:Diguanylate cyclase, GGDEF domain [Desulfacinum hydrothermale DSM 13146]|uniref:diguanylate cyclase n=1 Tax=Desulfacinum hydrothermale DSM 13146 TaxID=1121390 RepID=A0A1W1X6F8_9BACT|nr:GGDEF domain-containing protein [Desulfacinum hydrothermale]SMC19434.1 Diguanylate cyclase, GGDEF domain [Desulfacinum hydrothermale DSM 13146]
MSHHHSTNSSFAAHELAEAVLKALSQILPETGWEKQSLVETLAQDPVIAGMVQGASDGNQAQRVRALQDQVQKLRRQKDQLRKDALELQDKHSRLEEAARNSFSHLCSWAKALADSQESEILDEVKRLIVSEAHWEEVEKGLRRLRQRPLMDTPATERQYEAEDRTAPSRAESHLETLKSRLSRLLNQFNVNLGDQYHQKWTRLHEQLPGCQSLESLLGTIEQTLELAERFSGAVNKERAQLARFFSDIGQDLAEMEVLLSSTVNFNRESHQASQDFNSLLDGKMEEMSNSVNFSRTLEELKAALEAKLTAIKQFLKEKQTQDESRYRKADENSEVLRASLQRMKREVAQMEQKTKRLEKQALQDALTGVHNRRAFDMRIQEEMYRYQRYGQIFSLLIIDLDHFKKVNDSYGHATGDRCLKEVTRRMGLALRQSDYLARYGGEEFAVILPGTDGKKALRVAEKLRNIVDKTRFLYKGEPIPLSVSVGVTQVGEADTTVTDVFERADQALYRAKAQGRNRVESIFA